MLLTSLLLTCSIASYNSVTFHTDTIPTQLASALAPSDEREAEQVFQQHYRAKTYPRFKGLITWLGAGSYRLDSFTMRIDTLPIGVTGLLSRGLLYPELVAPVDGVGVTISITNFHELPTRSSLPHVRRFSCWVFGTRIVNPIWYVFELTNDRATADMNISSFIEGAQLTFIYQVSIII